MTPGERAESIANMLPVESMLDSEWSACISHVAAAIREAEAAAVERERLGRIDPKLAALALESAMQRARVEAFEEAAMIADRWVALFADEAVQHAAGIIASHIRAAAKRKGPS